MTDDNIVENVLKNKIRALQRKKEQTNNTVKHKDAKSSFNTCNERAVDNCVELHQIMIA